MNMLLLTLTWLYSYPKGGYEELANVFGTSLSTTDRIIHNTLRILDLRTKILREWPSKYQCRIQNGQFAGTIGAVDSFITTELVGGHIKFKLLWD